MKMMKWNFLLITFLIALGLLYFGPVHAKNSFLNGVNNTGGTIMGMTGCMSIPVVVAIKPE
jgi:hypothetical protein